jgi:hypothetical protein
MINKNRYKTRNINSHTSEEINEIFEIGSKKFSVDDRIMSRESLSNHTATSTIHNLKSLKLSSILMKKYT